MTNKYEPKVGDVVRDIASGAFGLVEAVNCHEDQRITLVFWPVDGRSHHEKTEQISPAEPIDACKRFLREVDVCTARLEMLKKAARDSLEAGMRK